LIRNKYLIFFLFLINGLNTIGQELDSLINTYYNKNEFAGIIAGISIDGNITQYGKAGFADLKNQIPYDLDKHTRIASIVKPMTAVAVMQLAEKGKIHLDSSIVKYIPEYNGPQKNLITVRQILNHTSGIPGYKGKREIENKKQYKNLEAAFKNFKKRALISIPGKEFHYTSYGYVVLGILIERVSNLSYNNYMKTNIWIPSWMIQTGIEDYKFKYNSKASLYRLNKKGGIQQTKGNNLSDRIPGGGVHSNCRDILHFGNEIIKNKLITDSSLQIMLVDPQIKEGGNAYALGFTLYGEKPNLGPIYGHSGSQTGASAILFIIPDKKAVITVISNTSGVNKIVGEIAVKLLSLLY
jgi:CubicO group peptidase (beta-lactamase class C family)